MTESDAEHTPAPHEPSGMPRWVPVLIGVMLVGMAAWAWGVETEHFVSDTRDAYERGKFTDMQVSAEGVLMLSPAMKELTLGDGLIDIVNSYVGVALASGLVGLSLFSGFFIAVAVSIFKGMRNLADRSDERYLLGQGLFSTLLGILVMIFTVSSITVIPVIYWSLAGVGVAYARMLALAKSSKVAGPVAVQRAPIISGAISRPDSIIRR